MADTPISSQIYLSRDQIRSQITDYIKTYLELENVDLTKTSFLSFIVNLLSTLTSNLMFYQSSVYREFFLTRFLIFYIIRSEKESFSQLDYRGNLLVDVGRRANRAYHNEINPQLQAIPGCEERVLIRRRPKIYA